MKGERILYPCYFNAAFGRNEGRRIPKSRAVKDPTLPDLEKAVKRAGLKCRVEQKHHPAHWWKKEGRLVVQWKESKEKLLERVTASLGK